jgi:hypothetical protein
MLDAGDSQVLALIGACVMATVCCALLIKHG